MSPTPPIPANDPPANPSAAVSTPKSPRQSWFRALAACVVVAGIAAAAVWLAIPRSAPYTARTLIRVPLPSTLVFQLVEPTPSLADHQRTQLALAKCRLVLNTALKRPGVGELGIVRKEKDPIDWLDKEVQADFSLAPKVLRIALAGENPEELKCIVNALRDAYRTEILDRERIERIQRLELLGKKREEYVEKLRTKRASQRMLERQAVTKDAGIHGLARSFAQMQLASCEHELLQTQSSLRHNRAEILTLRSVLKDLPTSPVPDADIESQLGVDPAVQAAQNKLSVTATQIEKAAAETKEENADANIQSLRKQLSDDQASVAALKKRLTPDAIDRARTLRAKAVSDSIGRLELEIATNSEIEKALVAQVDGLRQAFLKMAQGERDLQIDVEATTQLEEMTKRISDEEEKLRFEIDAPTRFSVIEEAIAYPTPDHTRAIAAASTFAGTFALVILGFALFGSRGGRSGAAG